MYLTEGDTSRTLLALKQAEESLSIMQERINGWRKLLGAAEVDRHSTVAAVAEHECPIVVGEGDGLGLAVEKEETHPESVGAQE